MILGILLLVVLLAAGGGDGGSGPTGGVDIGITILKQMKKIIFIFILIFINSCDSLIDQISNQFGSIKLTFNKPSEELIENLNNNRSESQFFDVDEIRITINNSSPETIPIIAGTAFYSKSGISVGNASIKVN